MRIWNGDPHKEIYIHMVISDARFNIALYEDHFSDVSFEYFKKYLRIFLLENGMHKYSRVVRWDFHLFRKSVSHLDGEIVPPPKIVDRREIMIESPNRFKSTMYVVWKNPIKVFNNIVSPLKMVS